MKVNNAPGSRGCDLQQTGRTTEKLIKTSAESSICPLTLQPLGALHVRWQVGQHLSVSHTRLFPNRPYDGSPWMLNNLLLSPCWILLFADKVKELVSKCLQARDRAYCPYSRFPVGAAILTADGAIITGNNTPGDISSLKYIHLLHMHFCFKDMKCNSFIFD